MQTNKTVIINGREYDAVTGLPITKEVTQAKKTPHTKSTVQAAGVHLSQDRSHTLNRRIVTKKRAAAIAAKPTPRMGRSMDIATSRKISKFAPHPIVEQPKEVKVSKNVGPTSHPLATRVLAKQQARQAVAVSARKTPQQIKNDAIAKALATPSPKSSLRRPFMSRHSRKITIIAASIIVLVIGAYLTLYNMPAWSVGLASASAGIHATYPDYQPDGYSLSQPVTFTEGEVTLNFVSNNGNGGYVIKQARSSWDSSAVLDNVVKKAAGDNYITTQEKGLTIYSYNGNAAWVSGGILYTITTSAPLSGEQLRHIATSL